MLSARDLAKYIISEIKKQLTDVQPEEFDVTPLKLQKLLYYCQGYSLALTGKPIFPEKIEAWKYGPVVDSVYQEYKKYEGSIIPYSEMGTDDNSDEKLSEIVHLVLLDKGQYSGTTLAQATHKERPWRESYGGQYTNYPISEKVMKEHFMQEFLKREEDYTVEDDVWDELGETVNISELEAAIEEI